MDRKMLLNIKLKKIEKEIKRQENLYRILHGNFPVFKINQKAYIPMSWLNEYWENFYKLNENLFLERKRLMEELNITTKIIPFTKRKIS
ncbi:hypothetical protein [Carboxydothermus ferrireducens]|uniref:Uncharacterized protein n=1 Tax=Carboxydothermus ferrireducens DSM 11255 TaxID=1119529 RepID=A0ABX2R8K1_9THEO|nr:hypothetical protein [Carboxydothermus ferrireducens]NYE56471.1 hypothetical protein [Carboxydothermus ferrireducens DSM 11255]